MLKIAVIVMVGSLSASSMWAVDGASGQPRSVLKEGAARVVFVGDSITGQSRNHPAGFARQIEWALKEAHPGCEPPLVSLGGSGHTVGSWLNIERTSRQFDRELDVKGVPVKASLDKHADVLVVMLGMNDILCPAIKEDDAGIDRWQASYKELVEALRARTTPAVVALCSITPCTEDMDSPKNLVRAKLNQRVERLAKELNCRFIPTGESVCSVLNRGRALNPEFHVTGDLVHPNDAGHIAIAMAMLYGLGDDAAAGKLESIRLAAVLKRAAGDLNPSLSWQVSPVGTPDASGRQSFRIHCSNGGTKGKACMTLSGDGWTISPASIQASEGDFMANGIPERNENVLKLECADGAMTSTREVRIPAPWLIAAGFSQSHWIKGNDFQPDRAVTPVDTAIESGLDFTGIAPSDKGKLKWQPYYASVNFTGRNRPGSVDFAAISFVHLFETGYGARWITSSRERAAELHLNTQSFAGNNWQTVWLNGSRLYAGKINAEPVKPKVIPVRLKQGINTLVFKSNHCQWQWQQSLDLKPAEPGDTLDDLRTSIHPPVD